MQPPQVRITSVEATTLQNEINRAFELMFKLAKNFAKANPSGTSEAINEPVSEGTIEIFRDSGDKKFLTVKDQGNLWRVPLSTAANQEVAALTDSSGGTADAVIDAVSGSGADAAINNNFASLTQSINNVLTALDNLKILRKT